MPRILTLSAAVAVLFASLSTAEESFADEPGGEPASIDLAFVTHLDMNLPEQDVFLERELGSGEVWRVTKGDNDMNAPLYKTAIRVEHNPFDDGTLGPYPKGEPMGLTLGDWLKHRGTGTYTCADGEGSLDLELSGLVPNSTYTIWHVFVALPPTTPFSGSLDLPLGARDGSESIFRSDANGNAVFHHEFLPCLEFTDVWTTAMIAIAYHSDDKTHQAYPGDFGLNSHVPMFCKLPRRGGI